MVWKPKVAACWKWRVDPGKAGSRNWLLVREGVQILVNVEAENGCCWKWRVDPCKCGSRKRLLVGEGVQILVNVEAENDCWLERVCRSLKMWKQKLAAG